METQTIEMAAAGTATASTNTTINEPFKQNADGNNTSQEISSTTAAAVTEPSKRSLRVQTWKKMQNNSYGVRYSAIFNRIPTFIDSNKAALNLTETDEFKNAQNIKVMIDRALYAIKAPILMAGKNLYLPGTRDSTALFLKVDVPEDLNEERTRNILNVQDVRNHRTEIFMENLVKLDMVIIGSVVVSRDGYRIGRGNGFNDLHIGILIETGAITPNTLIVTMVHDSQVVDQLPVHLFQKYDTPVDMIVTPSEVIRVAKRLPRPTGIYWELLSERRLKIVPVLMVLKEAQEKAGKIITLKENDTDIEQSKYDRGRRRGMMRRRFGGRRFIRRAISHTDTEQNSQHPQDHNRQRRFVRRNRYFNNRRRRPTKSEGDQSISRDRKVSGNGGASGDAGGNQHRRQRPRKNRFTVDFSIKVTNLRRGMRIKDLKAELRKRECNPMGITWKATIGRCFLHFGSRNGKLTTDEDMEKVLNALSNLSLAVNPPNNNQINANGGGGSGGAIDNIGNGGNNSNNQMQSAPIKPPKVVNLNVQLIKRNDRRKNINEMNGGGSGGGGNGVNSGVGNLNHATNTGRIETVNSSAI